ncbi:hypothetical protein DITRI_Ditri04bG0101000 [Diplodiscus trichospermus]
MTAGEANQLISVHPNDLKFIFELEKQSFCDLKVVNNSEHHVAFKVKTTSPKKYFVRPNTGVVQPWDSCFIRAQGNSEDEGLKSSSEQSPDSNSTVQQLKDERDAAVRQTLQLQQELDFMKRRRQHRNDSGFSITFAAFVGLIGIMVGFLLNLSLSSPHME